MPALAALIGPLNNPALTVPAVVKLVTVVLPVFTLAKPELVKLVRALPDVAVAIASNA